MSRQYAFYKSLRFRFGAVFGSLFLLFFLLIACFLYLKVRGQFEKAFQQTLESDAALVLGKTEINPLTLPVPQSGEQFLLLYYNGTRTDTLFPVRIQGVRSVSSVIHAHRSVTVNRSLETGGQIIIHYSRSDTELENSISELRSILFLYLPFAFLLSLLAGYFLSGFLLRPISRLITQANLNALESEIRLLPEPETEDELHALSRSLNNMLRRLQEARRQQNAFFAAAAHELRTPLSIMLTGLQVSRKRITDAAAANVIGQQVHEVQRLSALVDNLLLMSGLTSRAMEPAAIISNVNLGEIVMDHLNALAGKAGARGQSFRVGFSPPEADFLIPFQPGHLEIIIRNLMDNAIIHGTENSKIDVMLMASTGNPVRLIVANETGQQDMDLGRLTKEFEKGDPFREGFGLGLWIIRELARLNGAKADFHFERPKFTASIFF